MLRRWYQHHEVGEQTACEVLHVRPVSGRLSTALRAWLGLPAQAWFPLRY